MRADKIAVNSEKKGVIYIMTNPSFKGYVKIGYAADVSKRLKALNRSAGVPLAFRVYATYETAEILTDLEVHKLIDTLNPDLRVKDTIDGKERKKEFYAMSPEDAYAIFECIARISGTMNCLKRTDPTGKEMEDEQAAAEARHGKFRFGMCGIKQGEKIQFADDSSIEAEVVDDRHVKYKEDICTLAGLARLLMKKPTGRVSAAKHFMYKGRLLSDIRKELEEMPHI